VSDIPAKLAANPEHAELALAGLWKLGTILSAGAMALGGWAAKVLWQKHVDALAAVVAQQTQLAQRLADLERDGVRRVDCTASHRDLVERVEAAGERTQDAMTAAYRMTQEAMADGFSKLTERLDRHIEAGR
jgi:hypothetical protein